MPDGAEEVPASRAPPRFGWVIYGFGVLLLPPIFYWRLLAPDVPNHWKGVAGWWLFIWVTIALALGYTAATLPPGS